MAIVTSIQPFTLWRNVGFATLCLIFGIWGWYDYDIKIPRLERDFAMNVAAKETVSKFQKLKEAMPTAELTAEQFRELEEARRNLDDIKARYGSGVPSQPQTYDRPLQLWLYIIGCGVLGVPSFLWPVIRTIRNPYRMDDDGTLHTPKGPILPDEVEDIDMSRWCSPTGDRRSTWTAKLILKDGRKILLDDHDHRNMDMIIGAYAKRFHPETWTNKAKRVGEASVPEGSSEAPGA